MKRSGMRGSAEPVGCAKRSVGTASAAIARMSRENSCGRRGHASVAVGTLIAERPPHRTVRAAFPHTAPTSGPNDTPRARWRMRSALVTRQRGAVSGTCFAELHSPWPRPLAPPTPRRIAPPRSPASQLLWPRPTSHLRASPATAPHLPGTDRRQRCQRPDVGSPSFRRAPFARDLLFDPSGAPVPRDNGTAHVAFGSKDSLRPRDKGISGLNHTPHATAVYASRPPLLSARATLASRRLATPYLGWTSTSGSRQLTGAVLCPPYGGFCTIAVLHRLTCSHGETWHSG